MFIVKIIRKALFTYRNKKDEKRLISGGLKDIRKLSSIKLTKLEKQQIRIYCKEHDFRPMYHYYEVLKGNGLEPKPEFISWNNWCKRILPKYNDIYSSFVIDDKNKYDLYFKDIINMPKTLIRKCGGVLLNSNYQFIDKIAAINILSKNKVFIVKKSRNSSCGSGVYKIDNPDKVLELIFSSDDEFIVQEQIYNHDIFKLNDISALSTVRIYTMIENNNTKIMACILRISQDKSSFVDNFCAGGAGVFIDDSGMTGNDLFDLTVGYHTKFNNRDFIPFKIPFWNEIIALVKELSPRVLCSKIAAWDIAVTNNGPYLIECNLGIHDINLPQFVCKRPFFEVEDYSNKI